MRQEVTLEEALDILMKNKEADATIISPFLEGGVGENDVMTSRSLREVLDFPEGTLILVDQKFLKQPKKTPTRVKRGPYKKRDKSEPEVEGSEQKKIEKMIPEIKVPEPSKPIEQVKEVTEDKKGEIQDVVKEGETKKAVVSESDFIDKSEMKYPAPKKSSKGSATKIGRSTAQKKRGYEPLPALQDDKGKPVDGGKIRALYRAGWSLEDIADEMGYEDDALRGYMEKLKLL